MSEWAMIELRKVSKQFPRAHQSPRGIKSLLLRRRSALERARTRNVPVLREIDLSIAAGETLGIIGSNGVGKSTLLSVIAGVLRPSRGEVIVRGKVFPLLELGAGFHPELTGLENIFLNGILLGRTRALVSDRIESIIEFSELAEMVYEPVRIYSSGMLARLGFSVLAHLEPEILLIDEILSVGDIGFQRKCIDKILEFKRTGVTMVLVSHSLDHVNMLCDRVVWLRSGGLPMIGKTGNVTKAYLQGHDER